MNQKLSSYLKAIGATSPIIERAEHVYQFYQQLCSEEIEDVIVSEYLTAEGNREYENLSFFSRSFVMEAKNFLSEDDFDLDVVRDAVRYWRIRKWDYDFVKATDKSRLNLQFWLSSGMTAQMKASKENCDYLKAIALKYVPANLVNYPPMTRAGSPLGAILG